MNCQAQTRRPRAWRRLTTDRENWLQYPVPSPDLIRTVWIPLALAFFAIAPSLPCDEWLRYQIHMPFPARGFFAWGASPVVCETAPPLGGPVARAVARAATAMNSAVLRRRKRMIRGYEPRNTGVQGKLRRACPAYCRLVEPAPSAIPISAKGCDSLAIRSRRLTASAKRR